MTRNAGNIGSGEVNRLVLDYPIKATTFTWPRPIHVLLKELALAHTKQRGNANRSKMLAAAIMSWETNGLNDERAKKKVADYREVAVEDIIPQARHKGVKLSDCPYIRFSVRMPTPVNGVLEDLKESLEENAGFKTSCQELSATALYGVKADDMSETEIDGMVRRYCGITSSDIHPR